MENLAKNVFTAAINEHDIAFRKPIHLLLNAINVGGTDEVKIISKTESIQAAQRLG